MKKHFYYSKQQRIGTIVLMVLIALAVAGNALLKKRAATQKEGQVFQYEEEVNLFIAQLEEEEQQRRSVSENKIEPLRPNPQQQTLFPFDPNIADSVQFTTLGLSPKTAQNILKYRASGGRFRSTEEFSKIYGITKARFEQLRPYIRIAPVAEEAKEERAPARSFQEKRDTIIELNGADTTNLKLIRGIGSGYARAIVNYRNRLGGFYRVEQLTEVPNLRFETYLQIAPMFIVDTTHIRPIIVNRASLNQLRNHPYLTFTQAKEIYEYRRNRLKIKEIGEIRNLESITDSVLIKLKPYLSFE